jgi:hypothetical protein
VTDFSLFTNSNGTRTSGPANNAVSAGQTLTFGVEFTVTKRVWLKTAILWRNDSRCSGTPTFQLYQVNSSSSGTAIAGGAGTMPSGNYGGWGYGRTNPLMLSPGITYKMAMVIPNYYHSTRNQFWSGQVYANGLGNNGVISAPSAQASRSGKQMSYVYGNGYPNSDDSDTNFWVDVTVTDVDPTAVLLLGSKGSKGKYGQVNLGLGASQTAFKRVSKASAQTMHFAAVGFYQFSSSVRSALDLALDALGGDTYHHTDEIQVDLDLPLGSTSSAFKTVPQHDEAVLGLHTLRLGDFFRNVAHSVRDSLLINHWSEANGRFKQAAGMDAEQLSATAMGGLFLTAIGDHARGHLNIRHLRSFRVKNHDVLGPNYEGPRQVMGYKPYAELGDDAHTNPPTVIDQPGSWAAVLFKMRYGEPVGDDVDSLRKWNYTKIVSDPDHSLYGAQFIGYSRTVSANGYQTYARPSLAAAAWAILAASDVRGVLAIDAPRRPTATAIVLQSVPQPSEGRFKLAVSWLLDDGDQATYYEVSFEKVDGTGKWVPVFPQSTTGPLVSVLEGSRYVVRALIPAPDHSTSFRARIRVRNAEWGTSYSQAIPADRLAIRHFLDEDDLNQGVSGGVSWTSESPWRWLSPES